MKLLPPKLRTRIRDIVFGRTRIAVIDRAEFGVAQVRPIFIIGCFRSGTTLLRYLMDSHSQLCCPPETKFLRHLDGLRQDPESLRALATMGFDQDYLRTRLRGLSDDFFLAYMAAKGKSRWADKTPEYVYHLEFIDWLYQGEVDYVLIHRNGLDVTHSMFNTRIIPLEGNKTLDTTFDYWFDNAAIMQDWQQNHPENCLTIRYEDLCLRTKPILASIFDFLSLPHEDVTSVWHQKEHDMGFEDNKARRQEKIRLSHGNFSAWLPEDIERLKERARDTHQQLGYDPQTLMPLTQGNP
ncbi:MAG: sulfotransferase [Proteobacteria bacterium]|nr:sulfotransferase [Pseudomonadota bacterium]MBU1611642.1 sulfotransferase [Pseudomonadota bacterium]